MAHERSKGVSYIYLVNCKGPKNVRLSHFSCFTQNKSDSSKKTQAVEVATQTQPTWIAMQEYICVWNCIFLLIGREQRRWYMPLIY